MIARTRATARPRRWIVATTVALAVCASAGAQAQTMRPEIGRPLQAAQQMIKAGRYREALNEVQRAEAVPGRSGSENTTIERMRLAAASGAGDADTAARAFEALNMGGAEKLRTIESIAGTYYRNHEYGKAYQWYGRYFREGGTNGANRNLMMQAQFLGGNTAGVIKDLMAEMQAAERNGTTPPEDRISLLMNAAMKQKDVGAETYALERLVMYYPKKEYWANLLSRIQRKPGFAERYALDAYRLSLATGSLSTPADYSEMAQLALQAGSGAEAKQVVDKGFAGNVLGVGAQADRDKRLRDLIDKRNADTAKTAAADEKAALDAKDGNDLVQIGLNKVYQGQTAAQKAQGVQMMQQGIAKGGLKRPEDAKLHLGIAQLAAGQNAKALETLKTVSGSDGSADMARLWSLYARRAAKGG